MKYLSFVLLILMTVSCNTNNTKSDGASLLTEVIETYNVDRLKKATVRFTVGDLHYTLERADNISNFQLTRTIDGKRYVATYNNGYQEYFIDGEQQEDGTYSRFQLTQYLDSFTYIQGIPLSFTGNDVIAAQQESVSIMDKTFHTLHISFKPYEDSPEDEFYLYIDPETKFITYMAEKFHLNGEYLRFLKFVDHRYVEDILFADYFVLKPTDESTALNALYNAFNERKVEEQKKVTLTNIEVTIN